MKDGSQIRIFDRHLLRRRFDRKAAGFSSYRALLEESSAQLTERIRDVKRDFGHILDLGARGANLLEDKTFVVATNLSEQFARLNRNPFSIVADEEYLPFADESFDLVVSNLALHWVNDLPGALLQIKNILKPGGMFMAAMLGGQTLAELRSCLLEAEMKISGGASPRLSPTIDLQTASGLLQRAGFSLPVADRETVNMLYPDMYALMRDLRGMGEANAHSHRLNRLTGRGIFEEAARLYQARFSDREGRISAGFEIVFLHGWKG